MSVLSATIGVAVLRNRLATPALLLGIAISLLYWIIGQGLGASSQDGPPISAPPH